MVDNRDSGDSPPKPTQIPEVSASSYAKVVGEGWVFEGMLQMQKSVTELAAAVKHLQGDWSEHRRDVRSDFRWTWSGIAAAAVLFLGALIFAYFRVEDRQTALNDTMTRAEDGLNTSLTKVETKLDDLLARLPPPPLVPRQPNPQVR